jgi:zinc resistance-associated protein
MKRALLRMLSAAAVVALSAPNFTINAAAQSDQKPTHEELVQHWAEAAIDAQLKGMKSSLRLTADQEKDWPPFESAVKDAEKARLAALQKEQDSSLSPMDRLNAKAQRLTEGKVNIQKIVEAAKPLFTSLNDAQKRDFITLGRMLVPERGMFAKEIRRLRFGESDEHGAE